MEVQIKRTVKAGNSSAVVLPRAWLNKEVRVELVRKTPEIILLESLEIIRKYVELKEIVGIYLVGSYAREEEDKTSDIDILAITKDSDRELIVEGIYNVIIISEGLIKQKLEKDLFPIGQMIREAKPLLNSLYLESIKVNVTRKNVKWYLDSTEEKLKLIEKVMDKAKKSNKNCIEDRVIYTLVLRIRTLNIVKKLIKNEAYSKKDFLNLIRKISRGKESYERYLAVKNNEEEEKLVRIEEAERLYEYLKTESDEVSRLLK